MRVPIIQSWTSNTNDDVGVCWLLSLLYATRRSRMSHGEADVDLHAMRTLHARCRPAFCVSFFFFSSPTHSFSAPSKSLAKGTLRGTIGLDVSYFLFLREGELIVIITIVIIRRIKGGESGGKGTRFHCDCSHAHDKTRCYAIHPRHAFTRSRSFRHPSPATCPPGSARRYDDIPANHSQRSQC